MSARVEAARARRELEFLEVCEGYQDRLDAAKAVKAANPTDPVAVAEHRAAADEMHEFRRWARTVGTPSSGGPNDAVIVLGVS